ncbi:CYTH domain-containing protein [Ostreibacterium oceani]|uniref:CYTH domain-containing protein n=1 Tax=Ostreibacterium oceani TaxID=2654998 RepID=A0A6N7EUU7_9GAMM|nr:CYTH domain-containing protein [Ostreibacterium oceani]MPV85385.1 CYTH domain-containing protein [Ostreibacterium oceani]
MSIEIERKFLIVNQAWRSHIKEDQHITQGYIKTEDATVRIRCYHDDKTGLITVKGKREGISRLEFEYPIPYTDAQEMQEKLCQSRLVEKTRHLIEYHGMLWELDEFHGDNEGLFIAEIELSAVDQPFDLPDWVGEDVSFDSKYRNSRLCVFPYKDWE